jgi:xylulokinase
VIIMAPPTVTATTVLGIDLGTSSVKAVVTTVQGQVVAHASGAYPVSAPRPGWSETDPRAWFDATAAAVRTVLAEAGSVPAGVGLSGQMHGLVVADAAGQPLRPAMLWSDSRAVEQLASYLRLPAAVRVRLANPLFPGMAGPMLAWLKVHEPQTYAATSWALQPKDWLRAQLTGGFNSEPSDASGTLLYDVVAGDWDGELLEALGIRGAVLAPILPSSAARAGRLTAPAARVLGLRTGTPVAAGAADTASAALGSGLVEARTAQLTIGTGAQLVTPVETLPDPLPARPVTHLYRAATSSGWYSMGAVLNAGLTLDWVCRVLGASWPELYAAADGEPHPDDPYFLPHLNGERTPYLDPSLRGAWTDLGPRHERRHLLRAALEGVAFAVRDALQPVLSASGDVDHLRLAGGGTRDPAWRQLLADVLGYPLAPLEVSAASGLGAALLGAMAADLTDEETVRTRRPVQDRVAARPRPAVESLYRERHLAFTDKVQALKSPQ